MLDRHVEPQECDRAGFRYRLLPTYEINLSPSESDLFAGLHSECRTCIRKATKSGVTIEQATDDDFADDYWRQLQDVFDKRKLMPCYGVDRVRALMRHLLPTGQLLLLRARDADGNCLATGIFPAANDTMHFWGGASWRSGQHLRPNELLQWHAMRYWRDRGITRYNMGGGGSYKRKYGGTPIAVPWARTSRFWGIESLRTSGQRLFVWQQRFVGMLRSRLNLAHQPKRA
jgi:hypothetical protein